MRNEQSVKMKIYPETDRNVYQESDYVSPQTS